MTFHYTDWFIYRDPYPSSQRPLKKYFPGIVDCKPLLKQCHLYGKTIQEIVHLDIQGLYFYITG